METFSEKNIRKVLSIAHCAIPDNGDLVKPVFWPRNIITHVDAVIFLYWNLTMNSKSTLWWYGKITRKDGIIEICHFIFFLQLPLRWMWIFPPRRRRPILPTKRVSLLRLYWAPLQTYRRVQTPPLALVLYRVPWRPAGLVCIYLRAQQRPPGRALRRPLPPIYCWRQWPTKRKTLAL